MKNYGLKMKQIDRDIIKLVDRIVAINEPNPNLEATVNKVFRLFFVAGITLVFCIWVWIIATIIIIPKG